MIIPLNEPVKGYAPGSPERAVLEAQLGRWQREPTIEVPCVVDGQSVYTDRTIEITNPSDHDHVLARVHLATPEVVRKAIDSSMKAKAAWAALPPQERMAVFNRAADILAGEKRMLVNVATMLGQGKTIHQAEIDAVCELVDFWRFNSYYYEQILLEQPPVSPAGIRNSTDHRPLDGFVFAVAPFNFSSIALNLACAPALVGNVVLLKPSLQSSLSVWYLYQILVEAGLPPGVINLLHGEGADVGDIVMADCNLGGLHFTGSTTTFRHLYGQIGDGIRYGAYLQYPHVVGETGGKDFIVAHPSADPQALAVAIVRGAFEYQGQKCSAASRAYVPKAMWPDVRDRVIAMMSEMKMGDVRDLSNFIGPVIDGRAYAKIVDYVNHAHDNGNATVLAGGNFDRTKGWFIEPTLVQVTDPYHTLMRDEIFGPVMAVYPYDHTWADILPVVDNHAYALTGAVFAQDQDALQVAYVALRSAAGNYYVNDKPTGAVVGQQPFGGGRASGTNNKAGAPDNLRCWISPRTVKVTEDPPTDWRYPFLGQTNS